MLNDLFAILFFGTNQKEIFSGSFCMITAFIIIYIL